MYLAIAVSLLSTFTVITGQQECPAGSLMFPTLGLNGKSEILIVAYSSIMNETVALKHYHDAATDSTSIYQLKKNDTMFIMNKHSIARISDGDCIVKERNDTKSTADWAPLMINSDYDGSNDRVFTLADLLKKMKTLKFSLAPENASATEFDAKFDRFYHCSSASENRIWYNVTIPKGSANATNLPMEVEIAIYKVKDNKTTLSGQFAFRFVQVATELSLQDEEQFLPPLGVDCGRLNNDQSKKLPTMPRFFSVRSEYLNVSQTVKDYTQIYLDADRHLISFDYRPNLADQAISSGSDLNGSQVDRRVVHDFNTGLQYVINVKDHSCAGVSAIRHTWGDVNSTENRSVSMNDAISILLTSEKLNFSYVGPRYLNGLSSEVHVATSNRTGNGVVYELWIANVTGSDGIKSLPVHLRVYKKVDKKQVLSSQQTFYDYKTYDGKTESITPWYMIDVQSCLSLVQNVSYLVIEFAAEKNVNHLNFDALKSKLRTELANRANVSIIRVTSFFFQPVNESILYAFFVLGDRSPVNGSETVHYEPEIGVEEAHKNLNHSLVVKAMVFDLDGVKISTTNNALNFVPPFFAANNGTTTVINKKVGYTGGSMTVLAIFMLLIGAVGGFGLAFFLYKRNRGIQYQIYE